MKPRKNSDSSGTSDFCKNCWETTNDSSKTENSIVQAIDLWIEAFFTGQDEPSRYSSLGLCL